MKSKFIVPLFAAIAIVAAIMLGAARVAVAGNPTTEAVSLSASAGSATWTNAYFNKGARFIAVEYFQGLNATNTITLSRVRGTRTNTVCTTTLSGGTGVYREITNSVYFFRGDLLKFSSSVSTGTQAELTFVLEP